MGTKRKRWRCGRHVRHSLCEVRGQKQGGVQGQNLTQKMLHGQRQKTHSTSSTIKHECAEHSKVHQPHMHTAQQQKLAAPLAPVHTTQQTHQPTCAQHSNKSCWTNGTNAHNTANAPATTARSTAISLPALATTTAPLSLFAHTSRSLCTCLSACLRASLSLSLSLHISICTARSPHLHISLLLRMSPSTLVHLSLSLPSFPPLSVHISCAKNPWCFTRVRPRRKSFCFFPFFSKKCKTISTHRFSLFAATRIQA